MATVRIEDCRALGYCKTGVLQFMRRYGLSTRKFVKEGYSEAELQELDNAFISRLIAQAQQRETGDGLIRR